MAAPVSWEERTIAALDAARSEEVVALEAAIGTATFQRTHLIHRIASDQASLAGRSLYRIDLEWRRSARIVLEGDTSSRRPIPTTVGGLRLDRARPGSLEVVGQFYGELEALAASHPITLVLVFAALSRAKGLAVRIRGRRQIETDEAGFPVVSDDSPDGLEIEFPSWVNESSSNSDPIDREIPPPTSPHELPTPRPLLPPEDGERDERPHGLPEVSTQVIAERDGQQIEILVRP